MTLVSVIAECCYMTRCWWKTAFGHGLLILHYVNVELSVSQLNISYYVVQYMKLLGRKWLPILIQLGLCRNAKDDWTCQWIFFWHLIGIVKSVKNKTDTSNRHSSIFWPMLIGNYDSFISTTMLWLLVTIYCEVYNLYWVCVFLWILLLEIFLELLHLWCSILCWNLTHYGQHRDQQQLQLLLIELAKYPLALSQLAFYPCPGTECDHAWRSKKIIHILTACTNACNITRNSWNLTTYTWIHSFTAKCAAALFPSIAESIAQYVLVDGRNEQPRWTSFGSVVKSNERHAVTARAAALKNLQSRPITSVRIKHQLP